MTVPNAYVPSAKNLPDILSRMQDAGVPPRFTNEFLKSLGFTSSNDRAVIGVLKALGFVDQAGVPTDRYRRYRSKGEAPYVLAEAIRDAYSDVFLAHEKAETLPAERVKGIFATRTDKGDSVVEKMVATFRALVSAAKWDQQQPASPPKTESPKADPPPAVEDSSRRQEGGRAIAAATPAFHYNIQIHLPATKDVSVYNAIFRSLREYLM